LAAGHEMMTDNGGNLILLMLDHPAVNVALLSPSQAGHEHP